MKSINWVFVALFFAIFAALAGCFPSVTGRVGVDVRADSRDFAGALASQSIESAQDSQSSHATNSGTTIIADAVVVGDNNTVNIDNSVNNTTNIIIANTVTFVDGKFTGALDASRSVTPKAITVDLKSRQLVIAGPSSDGAKGAWLYEEASGSQQTQAAGQHSGKFKMLNVAIEDTIDSPTLFQRVNNTTQDGFLKSFHVVMDAGAPQASSSITVVGFDEVERQLIFPAGLLGRAVSGQELVTKETLRSLIAISDDKKPMVVMLKTMGGDGSEPIYFADTAELLSTPGRNWDQSQAARFGERITELVYANGAFQFRTSIDNIYTRTKSDILAAEI